MKPPVWRWRVAVACFTLVDVILPNIYQTLGIGFLSVVSHRDLSNLKALAPFSLTCPSIHTLSKAWYPGRVGN